jgi:hypothetical protein
MSVRQFPDVLLARNEVVAPPVARGCTDQSFELPPALYVVMGAFFFGFVGVLSLTFASPGLAVPFGIIVAFLIAFFAVPVIFVRAAPRENGSRSLRWSEFMESGVAIEHGRSSGPGAAVLVLLLPALIFCFALAIALIVAFA